MKKTYIIILFLLGLLALTTCHKDKEMEGKTPVVSNEEMTVAETQATISWKVDYVGSFHTGVDVSSHENMSEARRVEATNVGGKYMAVVDGLAVGTKYYYRIVVWNKYGSFEEETKDFETQQNTEYKVQASCQPADGGRVTGTGTYEEGKYCTLNAIPNQGYVFVNWTENGNQVSANSGYTFKVTQDRTLVAHFALQKYTISVSADPSGGGTVSGDGEYADGQSCTVTATANNGCTFRNWMENGVVVSMEANYTFVVTGDRTLIANFTMGQGSGNGTADDPYNVAAGIGLQNEQPTAWVHGFIVGAVKSGLNSVSGNSDINWSAPFDMATNVVIADDAACNEISQCIIVNLPAGKPLRTQVNLMDHPDNLGKHLAVNGKLRSYFGQAGLRESGGDYQDFVLEVNSYTIDITANPSAGGTVTGGGTYHYGETCTVSATPNTGFTFVNWRENGSFVSSDAEYSFVVTGNRNLMANFTYTPQAPTGAINGLFTINDNGDQVYFSQGNLQYIGSASTPYWKFADNQWDCLGNNGQGSTSQNFDRDLFGWGTSGYHDSSDPYNVNYQPWSTSLATVNENYNYYGYGPSTNMPSPNLTGSSAQYDWGVHNTISNTTGQWRTLTVNEWDYVFYTRSTTSGIRYAKAQVNNVNGVILLPDNWSSSYYTLSSTNNGTASFNSNEISSSTWTNSLEAHGAVFLPAAGQRNGTPVVCVGSDGYYWSASYGSSNSAYNVYFNDGDFFPGTTVRYPGLSVRLVCPAQ